MAARDVVLDGVELIGAGGNITLLAYGEAAHPGFTAADIIAGIPLGGTERGARGGHRLRARRRGLGLLGQDPGRFRCQRDRSLDRVDGPSRFWPTRTTHRPPRVPPHRHPGEVLHLAGPEPVTSLWISGTGAQESSASPRRILCRDVEVLAGRRLLCYSWNLPATKKGRCVIVGRIAVLGAGVLTSSPAGGPATAGARAVTVPPVRRDP